MLNGDLFVTEKDFCTILEYGIWDPNSKTSGNISIFGSTPDP